MIEDDIESETVLGDGRAGLLRLQPDDDDDDADMNPLSGGAAPPGGGRPKNKMRGLAGPISSNLDVSPPTPYSSS